MTEQERIDSIKKNGGCHLKNFKPENITYQMCLTAVSDSGSAIYYLPEQYRTKEIYQIASQSYGEVLRIIPQEYLTPEICTNAVKAMGTALAYVPDSFKTSDLCFLAVCKDPQAFQYVPNNILTPEFCARVVKQKGYHSISSLPNDLKNSSFFAALVCEAPESFYALPKKNRTAAICKQAIEGFGYPSVAAAVKDKPSLFRLLHPSLYDHDSCLAFVQSDYFKNAARVVPGQGMRISITDDDLEIDGEKIKLSRFLRYYDVCAEAVQANRLILESVPRKLITAELCELSVKADGYSFKYVPEEFRTREMCQLAFECYPWNLEDIPDQYKTPEMCLAAVKERGFLLRAIPDELKTHEMCRIAVADGGRGLDDVPECLFDKEIALLAINNPETTAWRLLSTIPEKVRDHDVCLAAVTRSGDDLEFVPDSVKDYEICFVAAQKGSHSAKYIPHEFFTPEVCLALTSRNATQFDDIPKDRLTTEACLEAVKHGYRYGEKKKKKVPRHLITQEMCDIAIRVSPFSLEGIPEEFVTEEILMHVADIAPGRLQDNFPDRFKTQDFVERMIAQYPRSEWYLKNNILTAKSTKSKEPIFTITDGVLTRFNANECLDITIPSNAKKIGRCVFWGSEIERIATAEGVISFEELSFSKCNSIKQFCISSTVRELPMASFRDELQGLREFVVDDDNELFASCDGVLYNKAKTELIRCPQSFSESVFVVPDSVTQIREHAFYGCRNLQEIVLPDHDLDIGDFAFSHCRQLKKVNLPCNTVSIPYGLFLGSAIETVDLPSTLKELGSCAFRYSKLKTITLPDGIQRINGYAFQPCPLSKIRIPKSVVSPIEENTFSSAEIEFEIGLVPDGYLLFGTDTKALEKFTYARSKKSLPLADEDFFELIENKTLLKKHFVFVAFLRAFIYDSGLSQENRERYICIVKNQKKRLLEYLASNNYEEYINKMLINKIATKQDVAKVREQV